MDKNLKCWIAHADHFKPKMDALAQLLASNGITVEPENRDIVGELPYVAKFQFGEVVTTIRFLLKDYQVSSDVVITNMTTLPKSECGKGFGSKAVRTMKQWSTSNGLNEIRATQISSKENESFWSKNGFERCPGHNPCNDFVFKIN